MVAAASAQSLTELGVHRHLLLNDISMETIICRSHKRRSHITPRPFAHREVGFEHATRIRLLWSTCTLAASLVSSSEKLSAPSKPSPFRVRGQANLARDKRLSWVRHYIIAGTEQSYHTRPFYGWHNVTQHVARLTNVPFPLKNGVKQRRYRQTKH